MEIAQQSNESEFFHMLADRWKEGNGFDEKSARGK